MRPVAAPCAAAAAGRPSETNRIMPAARAGRPRGRRRGGRRPLLVVATRPERPVVFIHVVVFVVEVDELVVEVVEVVLILVVFVVIVFVILVDVVVLILVEILVVLVEVFVVVVVKIDVVVV